MRLRPGLLRSHVFLLRRERHHSARDLNKFLMDIKEFTVCPPSGPPIPKTPTTGRTATHNRRACQDRKLSFKHLQNISATIIPDRNSSNNYVVILNNNRNASFPLQLLVYTQLVGCWLPFVVVDLLSLARCRLRFELVEQSNEAQWLSSFDGVASLSLL